MEVAVKIIGLNNKMNRANGLSIKNITSTRSSQIGKNKVKKDLNVKVGNLLLSKNKILYKTSRSNTAKIIYRVYESKIG